MLIDRFIFKICRSWKTISRFDSCRPVCVANCKTNGQVQTIEIMFPLTTGHVQADIWGVLVWYVQAFSFITSHILSSPMTVIAQRNNNEVLRSKVISFLAGHWHALGLSRIMRDHTLTVYRLRSTKHTTLPCPAFVPDFSLN